MNGPRSTKAGLKNIGKNVIFINESHFFVKSKHSLFVRKSAGERLSASHINHSVKHPQKRMFWRSFTWKGVGFLVPLERMMNTNRYIDVLTKSIYRFKKGVSRWKRNFSSRFGTMPFLKKTTKVSPEDKVQVLK